MYFMGRLSLGVSGNRFFGQNFSNIFVELLPNWIIYYLAKVFAIKFVGKLQRNSTSSGISKVRSKKKNHTKKEFSARNGIAGSDSRWIAVMFMWQLWNCTLDSFVLIRKLLDWTILSHFEKSDVFFWVEKVGNVYLKMLFDLSNMENWYWIVDLVCEAIFSEFFMLNRVCCLIEIMILVGNCWKMYRLSFHRKSNWNSMFINNIISIYLMHLIHIAKWVILNEKCFNFHVWIPLNLALKSIWIWIEWNSKTIQTQINQIGSHTYI